MFYLQFLRLYVQLFTLAEIKCIIFSCDLLEFYALKIFQYIYFFLYHFFNVLSLITVLFTFQDGRVNALYSTPSIYTDVKNAANEAWPLKTDDYFPWELLVFLIPFTTLSWWSNGYCVYTIVACFLADMQIGKMHIGLDFLLVAQAWRDMFGSWVDFIWYDSKITVPWCLYWCFYISLLRAFVGLCMLHQLDEIVHPV